jgi:hypothetical protein
VRDRCNGEKSYEWKKDGRSGDVFIKADGTKVVTDSQLHSWREFDAKGRGSETLERYKFGNDNQGNLNRIEQRGHTPIHTHDGRTPVGPN